MAFKGVAFDKENCIFPIRKLNQKPLWTFYITNAIKLLKNILLLEVLYFHKQYMFLSQFIFTRYFYEFLIGTFYCQSELMSLL